jgi:short-subunit dehydrogenase
MEVKGKVAWVIGASSGIGAALAQELLERGAKVAISARRQDQLNEVSAGKMLVLPADVTDLASLREATAKILHQLGPIDIAVISAGFWQQMSTNDWQTETFNKHVQINLIGTSNAIAAILPDMVERRSGLIAGIASVAGYRGLPGGEAYGATKAAQINLYEALRISLARSNVRVTTICPGFVRTDLTASNTFSMPFIIDADEAARSICDGLEKESIMIVFPRRMAISMKLAEFIPARLWASLLTRNRRRESQKRT